MNRRETDESSSNYLTIIQLTKRTSLSRSTILRMVKRDDLPAPYKLGIRRVGWLISEIEEWEASRNRNAPLFGAHRGKKVVRK